MNSMQCDSGETSKSTADVGFWTEGLKLNEVTSQDLFF